MKINDKVLMIAPSHDDGGIGKYTTRLEDNIDSDIVRVDMHPEKPTISQLFNVLIHILKPYKCVHSQHLYFGKFGIYSLFVHIAILFSNLIYKRHSYVTAHEIWVEDYLIGSLKYIKLFYVLFFHSIVYLAFEEVICLSSRVSSNWYGPEPNFRFIEHGVPNNVNKHKKTEARADLGISNDKDVVVMPGYINDRKNQELFISVAKNLPNVDFVIAGGIRRDEYKTQIDNLRSEIPKNAQITGCLSDDNFHRWFDAADIIYLPYKDIWQSGIFNNAAAHQCCVVSSDVGYFKHIKEKYECVEIAPSDIESSVKLIDDILNDKSKRRSLKKSIEKYAEENSFSSVANEHDQLYSNA